MLEVMFGVINNFRRKWHTRYSAPYNRSKMKKQQPVKPTRDTTVPVRCRDCANASEFIENSCYCAAMRRRTCACNRYGRICKYYEKKNNRL